MAVQTLEEARDLGLRLTLPQIRDLDYEGQESFPNQALHCLRTRPGDAELLQEQAEREGVRRMTPYGWGKNAFLVSTTEGQLRRITPLGFDLLYGPELKRPSCPRVLDSILPSEEFAGASAGQTWRVEYLNEVTGQHGNDVVLQEMKIFLAHLGFYVWDDNPENTRCLPDTSQTPIFVDPDTVARPLDSEEMEHLNYLKTLKIPDYYWGEKEDRRTWKQVHCFSQLNPDSEDFRKLKGLVDKDNLGVLENILGARHELIRALVDDGLYPSELPQYLFDKYQQLMSEQNERCTD